MITPDNEYGPTIDITIKGLTAKSHEYIRLNQEIFKIIRWYKDKHDFYLSALAFNGIVKIYDKIEALEDN